MGRKIANPTVTGKGSIPEAVTVAGTTLDTHATLKTKILLTGDQVINKKLLIGEYLYSNAEVREVVNFYPEGSIEIKSPFTVDLVASPLDKVRSGGFFRASVYNDDELIIGFINGVAADPKHGYEFEQLKGIDPITYDTNGANFLVATTQQ